MRIRYFGGLANANRQRWLSKARDLLAAAGAAILRARQEPPENETWQERLLRLTGVDVTRCPKCRTGQLVVVELLPRPPHVPAVAVHGEGTRLLRPAPT